MASLILDGTKLPWHRERVEAWLAGERVAPITIDCATTSTCQYKCVYCYGLLQTGSYRKTSRDAFIRFLDDAAEIGVKAISLVSDGESTCSPYIYEAILRAKANGLDIALGTNGYLLRDDRLEDILPALTYLRFNISAAEPKRYMEIHGCKENCFYKVINTIKESIRIKKERNLSVTLGLQMVMMPSFADQIIPVTTLGKELEIDYTIFKHCSDDESQTLRKKYGFDYSQYQSLFPVLRQAEALSTKNYQVAVKWSKLSDQGKRYYHRCYGPQLLAQFSGSGIVAPCGMLFAERSSDFHIGNLVEASFKQLWRSDRYWNIMKKLATEFDPRVQCGTWCLQDKVNKYLWDLKQGTANLSDPVGPIPQHVNFI